MSNEVERFGVKGSSNFLKCPNSIASVCCPVVSRSVVPVSPIRFFTGDGSSGSSSGGGKTKRPPFKSLFSGSRSLRKQRGCKSYYG